MVKKPTYNRYRAGNQRLGTTDSWSLTAYRQFFKDFGIELSDEKLRELMAMPDMERMYAQRRIIKEYLDNYKE